MCATCSTPAPPSVPCARRVATDSIWCARSSTSSCARSSRRQLKNRPDETRRGLELNELEKRMTEALLPHVERDRRSRAAHLHPIDEKHGFTSEIFMSEVPPRARAPGAQRADRRLQPARRAARSHRPRPLLPARRAVQDAGPHPRPLADDRGRSAQRSHRLGRRTRRPPARASPTSAPSACWPTASAEWPASRSRRRGAARRVPPAADRSASS